jgi:NADPH:quinone reductase-like Zn-dependent oxidoreductase
MRAAVLTSYDSPPRAGDFDDPVESDGNVLLDVSVAGINPVDLYTAAGELPSKPPLPSVAGREGIGTLDGRRVYFDRPAPPHGSMAERTAAAHDALIDVPDGVDDGLAVSFGIAGLAAWLGLEWRGEIQEGESVLVLGASGVVGQIAVQAARLLGASRVVAAARSEEWLERARDELGADAVVRLDAEGDELTERFRDAAAGGDGFDVVVDPLWGPPAMAALGALGERGRLVQIGNSAGATAEVPARTLRNSIRAILGHTNFATPQDVKARAFQAMCRHGANGELKVPVEELALDDVEDAWRRQAEGPHNKLVLRL